MPLNHNLDRLRRRAMQDVAKKVRLEPHLAKDMRRIFKSMLKDFYRTYPTNQGTITPAHYDADITGALRTHYRKVVKAFQSSTRDEIAALPAKKAKTRDISHNVNLKMGDYILKHSSKQASIIIRTTKDDLNDSINKVIKDAHDNGEHVDSHQIAKLVSDDYSKKISGRAKMIALTETQSLAEKTKDAELEELNDAASDDGESTHYARVWVAILDERTRDWHADADGQVAEVGQPFVVDGESLDYPGDPNGSPENIINCRCTAVPVET